MPDSRRHTTDTQVERMTTSSNNTIVEMNTLTMGDVGIRNTIICFYPPIPLHLKELIDIYPLEIAHMAKFNPVLSYAIMTNEDKMAFNKPV